MACRCSVGRPASARRRACCAPAARCRRALRARRCACWPPRAKCRSARPRRSGCRLSTVITNRRSEARSKRLEIDRSGHGPESSTTVEDVSTTNEPIGAARAPEFAVASTHRQETPHADPPPRHLLAPWPSHPPPRLAQSFPSQAHHVHRAEPAGRRGRLVGTPASATRWPSCSARPSWSRTSGGASGNIAYQQVARAPKDGYTLLVSYSAYHVGNPAMFAKLPWDQKDLVPVALIAAATNVITAHPSIPANNLKEFIAYVKTAAGQDQLRLAGQRLAVARRHRAVRADDADRDDARALQGLGRRRSRTCWPARCRCSSPRRLR